MKHQSNSPLPNSPLPIFFDDWNRLLHMTSVTESGLGDGATKVDCEGL
jgi:hypothetical protein